MDFVLKQLKTEINVSSIANVHFFEFSKTFYTKNDKHPFSELLFVESGVINVSSENYVGPLKKGEMIIHRPNEYHFLKSTEKNEPKVIIIGFKCDSEELNGFSVRPYKLKENDIEKLAEIVKEGRNIFSPPYDIPVYDMKEKKNKPYAAMQLLKILIETFLITIIRETRSETMPDHKNSRLAVAEVVKYVNENFKEKLFLDELAFLFGTNRSTICKSFKDKTGKTIGEYVNDKKINFLKNSIVSTEKTFSELADELHFDSIHYFSAFFKKRTGFSPSAYKKASSSKNDNS